jgi:RNA polymerase sigma-70 factor (ECF subfamily)
MPEPQPPDEGLPRSRLGDISTHWTTLARAGDASPAVAARALERIHARYGEAIRRYLAKALHNPDAADEVFQEFALRLCRGALLGADPRRGRFRNYLKTTLHHLIVDHLRRERGQPRGGVGGDVDPPAEDPLLAEIDQAWVGDWRGQILDRVWAALERAEREGGPPYATVLRLRADEPDLPNAGLTARLGARLGRPLTEAGVRQTLHRARERFARQLLDEVREVLRPRDDGELEESLIDLGLWSFPLVRFALERERRREGSEPGA